MLYLTHSKLEFLPLLRGLSEKACNLSSVWVQTQEIKFCPNKSYLRRGRDNGCVKVMASSSAILELVPETKKENLEFELPIFDPSKGTVVDLAVVGGGPAGLAVAQQEASEVENVAKCISNGVKFHQAKVIKVIHEESKSLLICNDGVTVQATVVFDATGFSSCLVQYDKPYNPGYQMAYGIMAEEEEHPFDVDKMVFMDWRDSHLINNRIFLEETSLVARPGVPVDDIKERMVARLRHLGIKVKSIEEDEHCVIPMGGPLPVLSQRVVGIGGTAGMGHPSTGYMVARTLAAAPIVADSIVQCLDSERNLLGNKLSADVWKDLWPLERRQREIFCFGMDILLKL
ncbi:hypothetical protein CRYUN_Cryun09bG0145800 [Craigia yunnanensis]